MTRSSLQQVAFDPEDIRLTECGLCVLIAIVLFLKFRLIFQISINQDEFLYLSHVYSYYRGSLTDQFQTFHVHFFNWVSYFSRNEVTQIIVARSVMYLFFLATCLLTYLIGRQFINRSGALFAVICFLSFSYVVVNGSSFRSDTISAFFCLFSSYMIIARTRSRISLIIAGLAIALSLMVTIKSIFHLLNNCVILMCILLVAKDRWNVFKQIAYFVAATAGGFFLFYWLHADTLVTPDFAEPTQFLSHTFSKAVSFDKLFPGRRFFELSIYQNFVTWPLLLVGMIFVSWATIHTIGKKTTNRLILLSFLTPLLSLILYRNSFPYFYVFILTPPIILCGVVVHEIVGVVRKTGSVFPHVLVAALTLVVFAKFVFYYSVFSPKTNIVQRDLLEVVHEIFPEPVSYVDGFSMVASFSKAGFVMSSWGMEDYLRTNKPIMKDILTQRRPLFLLANVPHLNLSLPRSKAVSATKYSLLEEDWSVLKSNFIHHWGPLYVIGKQFKFNLGADSQDFEILIPGEYTLEGELDVSIDGIPYRPGDIINVKEGSHAITALQSTGKAALRWGQNLYKPANEPSLAPIFFGPFL